MRYLVLTDIHANLEALDACLADASARAFDRVLVLGDIVGYGADPDAVIDRVPADGRRPLAADRAGFERLYYQRRAAYEQAHVRLDAGRASVDALVEQLVDWLEH